MELVYYVFGFWKIVAHIAFKFYSVASGTFLQPQRPSFSPAVLGGGWKALLAVIYCLRHNATTALEEQCPLHPVSSIDHLEAERVLVSLILH